MDYNLLAEKTTGLDGYVADVGSDFRMYADRYAGYTDEVRFSNSVLTSSQFLQAVPEPGTATLLGAGLFVTLMASRRRSKRQSRA